MRLKFLKSDEEKTGSWESGASVDGVEHTAPARAGGEMSERVEDGENAPAEGGVRVIAAGGVNGPVNEERAAHDGLAVDEAPITAVGAVVAIVAHGEIFSGRDDQFVALNVFADLVRPFDLHGRDEKLIAGRR